MSSFLESIKEHFDTSDLYQALGVDKGADDTELKKAYRRLSLKVHPDRVSADEVAVATKKFQVLGKIYSILSDKDKRAVYDEDGTVDEEDSSVFRQDMDWTDFWGMLFRITTKDIDKFSDKFKHSEEEAEELRSAYLKHEGDMDKIMDEVTLSSIDDEPRFTEMLNDWIKGGEVLAFPGFTHEPARKKKSRKRRYEQEAAEAKELQANGDREDSLKQMILERQESREKGFNAFFDQLEDKYAKKPKKKAKSSSSSGESSQTKETGRKKKTSVTRQKIDKK